MSSSLNLIPAQKGEIVKITSALGDASKDRRHNWPATAIFNTILKNVDGEKLCQSVQTTIRMGLEEQNQICCSCTDDCSKNPDCECLQMAQRMEKVFKGEVILDGKFIENPVSDDKKIYYDKPRFVCGPRCSCHKKCPLNAIQHIDKNQADKFEVSRCDAKGFGLYTKKDITAGTPIISFNGEIVGQRAVAADIDVHQYALQIIADNDRFPELFSNCKSIAKEYKHELRKAYKTSVFVNPLKKGNVARFANHSCDANMEILRVFQGGVSPADLRIVLTATKDIKAGEELTWNYGPNYVREHLGNDCLCEKCKKEKRTSRKRSNEHLGSPRVTRSQAKKSN